MTKKRFLPDRGRVTRAIPLLGGLILVLFLSFQMSSLTTAVASSDTPAPNIIPSTLSPADWQAIQAQLPNTSLIANNPDTDDEFGRIIAISGDTVVVGAYREDSNATDVNGNGADNSAPESGAAYVFVRNGTGWSQQAYLKASNTDVGDNFGISVDIDGDTLVVGAVGEASSVPGVNGNQADNNAPGSGAAYVFVRNGDVWTQEAYLKASNPETGDFFGTQVAIDGDTIIVGAHNEDSNATGINGDETDNSATDAGAAYLFTRTGGMWSQEAYLKASNTDAGDYFGWTVAASDGTVVVGAQLEDSAAKKVNGSGASNTADNAGAAYVFARNSNDVWRQQAYLKAFNAGAGDEFGTQVAIDGDTIVVGAHYEDSNATGVNGNKNNNSLTDSGAAYVFVRKSNRWSQQAYLKASNPDENDRLGYVLAVSGDNVVLGAFLEDSNATAVNGDEDDNSLPNAGAAYLFTREGTAWQQEAYLKADTSEEGAEFGRFVGMSGGIIVAGAPFVDSAGPNTGATYVFDISALSIAATEDFAYELDKNESLTVASTQGVLANDVAAWPLTAVLTTPPTSGTLTLKSNGGFTFKPTLNYTGVVTFTYAAQASLGGVTTTQEAVAWLLVDVEGPVDITLSNNGVQENLPLDTAVGDLQSRDLQGQTHTYTLVSGPGSNDNGDFAIVGNQLVTKAFFDYEAGQSPTRRIRVRSDNGRGSIEKSLVINILDEVTEPAGPPDQCNGNDITLYDSGDGQHAAKVTGITVSNFTPLGCDIAGTLDIRFQSAPLHSQAYTAKVDRWNKLTSDNNSISDLTINVAGVEVRARDVQLAEYNGLQHIRFGQADVCAPAEWGNDCVDGTPSNLRLDNTGLFVGTGDGLPMPNFTIDQATGVYDQISVQSPMSGFTSLLKLSAKETGKPNLASGRITDVPGGQEISASLALGLPRMPIESGCYILVQITLFKSNTTGDVTMTITPLDPNSPTALEFREGTLGMGCEQGIPIANTGLQITEVKGTLSLRPDMQFVQLSIEIKPIGSLSKVAKGVVSAKVMTLPEWGFDLSGQVTLFKAFDAGGFNASVRQDQMSFTAYVQTFVLRGDVAFYAWWPDGSFHFSGSGKVTVGVPEGGLFEKCVDPPFFSEKCISIPPFNTEVGSVQVEGGEFTNGQYGFKGFVSILGKEAGFFVSEDGDLDIGGVSEYSIATPPDIERARAKWLAQQELVELGSVTWDEPFGFPAPDVLTLDVAVNPSDVISQVIVANPSDTFFAVSTANPLSVTLKTPNGDTITPNNVASFNATYTMTDYVTYTQHLYGVEAAEIGDWQVMMVGDTTSNPPVLSVLGLANIPTVTTAVVNNASDPSAVEIDWNFTSDTPVTVTIYATAGDTSSSVEVEDSDGFTTTEVIDNFNGIPVKVSTVNTVNRLSGAQAIETVDLSGLESGTYALWLAVDNGIHPEINKYVTELDNSTTAQVAVDNAAQLPTSWTPTISATIVPERVQIVVEVPALANADVDVYGLNISQTPNSPELTVIEGVAMYERDADGRPVGEAYVRQAVNGVRPNETYYVSVMAFDDESGWSVTSQEIMVTIPAGDYQLNTAVSRPVMEADSSLVVPVTLEVLESLFYPNVYLELDSSDLPRGLTAQFVGDALGTTNLSSAQPTAQLLIQAGESVPDGTYQLILHGRNGTNQQELTLTIQVGETQLYLPLVMNGEASPPPPATSIPVVTQAIPPRPASQQGEVFHSVSATIPSLQAGGRYVLSRSATQATAASVDDEVAIVLNGQELFSYNYGGADGIESAVVEVPSAVMAQITGQEVTILLRDTDGGLVGATELYLIWTP